MAKKIGISDRAVRKNLSYLAESRIISRRGGRKIGEWIVLDDKSNKGIISSIYGPSEDL